MIEQLSHKQRRFVEEYLIDGNATGAADRAGYSDSGYGRQLLSFPNVRDAIQEGQVTKSSPWISVADFWLQQATPYLEELVKKGHITCVGPTRSVQKRESIDHGI